MNRLLCPALCLLLFTACPSPGGNPDPDGGPKPDGGTDTAAFTLQTLDATATDRQPLAAVLLPNDKVGVAYFLRVNTDAQGNGVYDLRYLEWSNGTVSASEKIDTVTRVIGLGMAVQPNGQPAVAYLGGNDTTQSFWFQNDAYLAYRTANRTWAKEVVVQKSDEAPGNAVSNAGFLVGLHAALAFDGATAYYAYRDCHNGQSPQGDYNASDLEVASGWVGGWTKKLAIGADGVTVGKQGYGGHNQLLVVNHGVTLVSDRIINLPGFAGEPGADVTVMRRDPVAGTWSTPKVVMNVANTQTGPSVAYDAQLGYAIAAVDANTNQLSFISSPDGNVWSTVDPVWRSGKGGWYPSLAIDPSTHDAEIAYYFCSNASNAGSCNPADDELRLTARLTNWSYRVVDPAGGYLPKLLFLGNGKRVIVYRDVTTSGPTAASLKLAVER